jgi:hypothetical protein
VNIKQAIQQDGLRAAEIRSKGSNQCRGDTGDGRIDQRFFFGFLCDF